MIRVANSAESGPVPRVAVIVPAYGVAHLLHEALDSLLAQRLTDWECVVVDDGAPDDVAGAVAPYLTDPRIRFLHTENGGVSRARNRAITATRAPLVALLDGDDRFTPDYLAQMVAELEADPAARLVTCNARIFGAVPAERLCFMAKQGTSDGRHGSLADVIDRSFGVYIGTTFRRSDFDTVGGFDTTMAQSEDFDLWVQLMLLGGHARYVDAILGEYRVRPNSASANAARMLLGNIKVYDKAKATLAPDRAEHAVLDRMIAQSRTALAFEHAMDKVIDGNARDGVAELRALPERTQSPVWRIALLVWSVLPGLARPMLRWRRQAHKRGAQGGVLPSLGGIIS